MHTLGIIAMGMPGTPEILLIIFIILLLFGAKKLPELSRSLGKSLGEFKKGQKEGTEPDKDEDEVEKKEIVSDSEETETKE
jgi:sec-independent protein translocase protein TatA